MRAAQSTDLDALCSERGWSRAQFVREFRAFATGKGVALPADNSLGRMVRMWTSGERQLSPFYADLLSAMFGVTFGTAAIAKPAHGVVPRQRLDAASTVASSAAQSEVLLNQLSSALEPLAIEQFAAGLDQLAVEYMNAAPGLMAAEAMRLRDRLLRGLERARRPSQISDLYVLAGRASGILAYAALDLGNARAAMTNARSALAFADLSGHTRLTAWVRGTQSLIARFAGQHRKAEEYALAGISLRTHGTGPARLAAGLAQCLAHLGDASGARDALHAASDLHGAAESTSDEVGLFGFARSKVHYYAASALVVLPDGEGAESGVAEALTAIGLFQSGPAEDRFFTDEILAHIHASTGLIQQAQLEEAADMLDAVLRTTEDKRVSWHRQRLATIGALLRTPRFHGSRGARELLQRLDEFKQTEGRRR